MAVTHYIDSNESNHYRADTLCGLEQGTFSIGNVNHWPGVTCKKCLARRAVAAKPSKAKRAQATAASAQRTELLEALKAVMASEHSNAGGGRECCCVAHETARAAIAKAEGRS